MSLIFPFSELCASSEAGGEQEAFAENPLRPKKKAKPPQCDLYDVALGSPAILFESEYTSNRNQQEILRPMAFRPHLTVNLGLRREYSNSQQVKATPCQEPRVYIWRYFLI